MEKERLKQFYDRFNLEWNICLDYEKYEVIDYLEQNLNDFVQDNP